MQQAPPTITLVFNEVRQIYCFKVNGFEGGEQSIDAVEAKGEEVSGKDARRRQGSDDIEKKYSNRHYSTTMLLLYIYMLNPNDKSLMLKIHNLDIQID